MLENATYRRKKDHLEWHFMNECSRWPAENYLEQQSEKPLPVYLLCHHCRMLHLQKEGKLEPVKKKKFILFNLF